MNNAAEHATILPTFVITDKLRAYLGGVVEVFGKYTEHLQSRGFKIEPNTNLIERFHGTLKGRVKIMRGLKSRETAKLIMDGWLIHYNFFRPHESLRNRTPGEEAEVDFPFKNWTDVVISESPIFQ